MTNKTKKPTTTTTTKEPAIALEVVKSYTVRSDDTANFSFSQGDAGEWYIKQDNDTILIDSIEALVVLYEIIGEAMDSHWERVGHDQG